MLDLSKEFAERKRFGVGRGVDGGASVLLRWEWRKGIYECCDRDNGCTKNGAGVYIKQTAVYEWVYNLISGVDGRWVELCIYSRKMTIYQCIY